MTFNTLEDVWSAGLAPKSKKVLELFTKKDRQVIAFASNPTVFDDTLYVYITQDDDGRYIGVLDGIQEKLDTVMKYIDIMKGPKTKRPTPQHETAINKQILLESL